MKKIALFLAILSINFYPLNAQTAVNFNCNDCAGNPHDLFTELDAGKIIVIAWVMPCPGCITGATQAFDAVQSFQTAYPNKVYFYMVDDYANTTCTNLGSWASSNGMHDAILFSDASISMSDYGVNGMPKVVVLGGTNHEVFYNENNEDITQPDITNAITTALGVAHLQQNENSTHIELSPNPAKDMLSIKGEMFDDKQVKYFIYDEQGKEVFAAETNFVSDKADINVESLKNGVYFLSINSNDTPTSIKFVIAR